MSAKILKLKSVRRSEVVTPAGIVFPQIYRVTGFSFKLREGAEVQGGLIKSRDDLEESTDPVAPSYTLDTDRTAIRIAKETLTPINHLDSSIDKGWLVIRHHKSREELHGYVGATIDTDNRKWDGERFMSFETDLGLFSILHRSPNEGTPDCLIIYISEAETAYGPGDHVQILDSHGNWQDEDVMYPAEYLEQMSGVMDLINKNQ